MTHRRRRARMRNRIDDLISTLAAEDRMTDLEHELDQVTFWKLRSSERETWHYARGIAAFRRGDYAQALQRFEKGRTAAPRSARIAFALGQEYERVGRVADMLAAFDACPFPRVPSAYALMQARFAYLWDRPQKALQYVLPILDAYEALQIADDHFLFMQGLPFFSETWSYLGAFLELTGDLATLRALTERARQHLKEYAFDGQVLLLECLERDDVTPLIEALEQTVQEGMALGWPVGYPAICLAVLQSQRTDDPQEAEHILDAVTLSDEDPPLLDDIRLLARCAVARRAGDNERESVLMRQFLERQPMLLEPSRAFDVRLLQYQERLKPLYREGRVHTSASG
jgi:tetratricopeptide (TPR) repeat protein